MTVTNSNFAFKNFRLEELQRKFRDMGRGLVALEDCMRPAAYSLSAPSHPKATTRLSVR